MSIRTELDDAESAAVSALDEAKELLALLEKLRDDNSILNLSDEINCCVSLISYLTETKEALY